MLERILIVVSILTAIVIAIILVVKLMKAAETSLQRIYEELNRIELQSDKFVVSFVYHTYSGFLLYVKQTEHKLAMPYETAEKMLDRLFKYNLRWGFFAYGALLIPLLAYLNYVAQKRSIKLQHTKIINTAGH